MALWKNNGWNWGAASGVYVPTNQWSLVAGVVTSTNITVYMFNTNGVQSGSTNFNNGSQLDCVRDQLDRHGSL